jgi:hypothetical protein
MSWKGGGGLLMAWFKETLVFCVMVLESLTEGSLADGDDKTEGNCECGQYIGLNSQHCYGP